MNESPIANLQQFGAKYKYDVEYLGKLYKGSPAAFQAFMAGQAMGELSNALPLEAGFVAKISTMQVEDCGPCTELNLKMAIEAGVSRDLLDMLLHHPDKLPQELQDIRSHTRAVLGKGELSQAVVDRIRAEYGEEGFMELAVTITGTRIYPTLKRAMLENKSCIIGELDY